MSPISLPTAYLQRRRTACAAQCPIPPGADTSSQYVVLDSDPDRRAEVVGDIAASAGRCGFSRDQQVAIAAAVDEALRNAIVHGNARDRARKVFVQFWVDRWQVRIKITDQGAGFDPRRVPDPSGAEHLMNRAGRGLFIMRHFMSGVRYHAGGNQVEMWKRRDDDSNGDLNATDMSV